MSQPRVVIEMPNEDNGEETIFVPVDELRQTFFSDLDASSKVNPNRRRLINENELAHQAYVTTRENVVGTFNNAVESIAADLTNSRDASVQPTSPERHHDVVQRDPVSTEEPGPKKGLRVTCAMLTNTVAGGLAGALTRRCTGTALSYVGAGVVVTQTLVIFGYAKVRWKALVGDTFQFIFKGWQTPPDPRGGRLQYYLRKLLTTLTATIPRRLTFWAGAVGGFLLL